MLLPQIGRRTGIGDGDLRSPQRRLGVGIGAEVIPELHLHHHEVLRALQANLCLRSSAVVIRVRWRIAPGAQHPVLPTGGGQVLGHSRVAPLTPPRSKGQLRPTAFLYGERRLGVGRVETPGVPPDSPVSRLGPLAPVGSRLKSSVKQRRRRIVRGLCVVDETLVTDRRHRIVYCDLERDRHRRTVGDRADVNLYRRITRGVPQNHRALRGGHRPHDQARVGIGRIGEDDVLSRGIAVVVWVRQRDGVDNCVADVVPVAVIIHADRGRLLRRHDRRGADVVHRDVEALHGGSVHEHADGTDVREIGTRAEVGRESRIGDDVNQRRRSYRRGDGKRG